MLLETVGFVVLGFAVGYGAPRMLPDRFPSAPLVHVTGPSAALLGGWVARSVFGPGHTTATLIVAATVAVALVTLLLRPKSPRVSTPSPPRSRTRHA